MFNEASSCCCAKQVEVKKKEMIQPPLWTWLAKGLSNHLLGFSQWAYKIQQLYVDTVGTFWTLRLDLNIMETVLAALLHQLLHQVLHQLSFFNGLFNLKTGKQGPESGHAHPPTESQTCYLSPCVRTVWTHGGSDNVGKKTHDLWRERRRMILVPAPVGVYSLRSVTLECEHPPSDC